MRNSAGSAGSQNLEGLLRESSAVREEVIDRAPPADPNWHDTVMSAKTSLQASQLDTNWRRWSSVVQELGGKNTREQLMQMGSIGVVILLRTMLQVFEIYPSSVWLWRCMYLSLSVGIQCVSESTLCDLCSSCTHGLLSSHSERYYPVLPVL